MKPSARTAAMLVGIVAGGLALTGCSSADSDVAASAPAATAPATTAPAASPVDEQESEQDNTEPDREGAQASLSPQVDAAMNAPAGTSVGAGTIPSTRVEGLDKACEQAIEPLRAIMAKYDSGLAITSGADNDQLSAAIEGAQTGCEDPQQWADFYSQELYGWLNG